MADDHSTAGESFDALFQSTEGVHVDVVGRLVQQQHIGFRLEGHGQVQPVALASRQHAALLLLVGTVEVEFADVRPAVEQLTSNLDLLVAA